MADIRLLVSWGRTASPVRDWCSNTLYFVIDGLPSDEQIGDVASDVADIYRARGWTQGSTVEVRAYKMADETPRPEIAFETRAPTGVYPDGPAQVALCLSYYSGRNLPQQRGRIYLGPWGKPGELPTSTNQTELLNFATSLAGVGGVNVDWSVYSPTRALAGEDPSQSISNVWVDNSWDIQRRRKVAASNRAERTIDE